MNLMDVLKTPRVAIAATVFVFSSAAQAQIPVTDMALISTSVSNQVESIAKWTQQFNQMKQQIQQYQQQYAAITGARGMGSLLDNTAMKSALPADWQQVLTSIKTTSGYVTERAKYPTFTSLPKANAMYDVIASQNAVMSDLYSKASKQVGLVQQLTAQIDSATDPAAKTDLANRLISETNAIQANQNLVAILQSKQKQELEAAAQLANQEHVCKEFKRSGC